MVSISENTIAASNLKRRNGCRANSVVAVVLIMSSHGTQVTSTAWRMSQMGVRATCSMRL